MFFTRLPFLVGAILHLILVFSRTTFSEFRCTGSDCSGLVFADFPVSLIYLAFSDGVVIVFSLLFGTLLWGLYGLGIYSVLLRIFKED